ncbi:acyltransferase [Leptospira fluminis]|uniref:Acyltransferase n=1 Tax=Leptospira fluminis TaxID=2484979 RepID=A0A4R9GMI3_9LEPT|nr:acyltransferase [Leptospira fluminis]TGK17432.1 acyltransferase [Leptospira fluminis]
MKAVRHYFFGIFKFDPREIAPLNGLRSLGFFLVVAGHMYRPFESKIQDPNEFARNFFSSGSFAMDIFFVLSGFLISGPLFRELDRSGTIRLGVFFSKRTIRIFPPYFIFLSLQTFLLFPLLIKLQPDSANELIQYKSRAIFDFLYISNYFPGTVPHGWSLSLEEQFYLLFPPFLLVFFRRIPEKYRIYTLLSCILFPTMYRFIIFKLRIEGITDPVVSKALYHELIYYPLHTRLDSLFTGILLSYVLNRYPDRIFEFLKDAKKRRTLLLVSAVAVFYIIFFLYEFSPDPISMVFRFNLNAFACAAVMLLSLRPESLSSKLLSFRIFSPIAKLSYCAYLIHFFLAGILTPLFVDVNHPRYLDFALAFVPAGFIVLFFGYLFHLVAERPFMVWKESRYGKEVILSKKENAFPAAGETG